VHEVSAVGHAARRKNKRNKSRQVGQWWLRNWGKNRSVRREGKEMVAGARLRGMLGSRRQGEFVATEDVAGAVAIAGVWVPTATLLNYCGAGGCQRCFWAWEKQESQQESYLTVCCSLSGAHEVLIDQNTKKKTSKLMNSFGTQGFCCSHIVSKYFL
jgi:hypothetical protein